LLRKQLASLTERASLTSLEPRWNTIRFGRAVSLLGSRLAMKVLVVAAY